MEKINNTLIAKELLNIINKTIFDVDNIVIKINEELEKKNKDLSDINLKFLEMSKVIDNLIVEKKETEKYIADIKNKLDEDILKFENEKNSFYNSYDKELLLLNKNIKNREVIEKEIEDKNKILISLNNKIVGTESLKSELDNIIQDIQKKKDILTNLDNTIIERNKELNQLVLNSKKELDDIKLNKEKELNNLLPTIESLNARDKELKKKEADLDVVISRYKKLYEEKGGGFKI